mmetsp:Transcript_3541/g.8638  ORF Transcript_3541/g.8638 Transcript_3541/m.8638 type:complete len:126 (-) Transcript_3541:699-1076(-)
MDFSVLNLGTLLMSLVFDSGSEVPDQGSTEVQFLIRDLKFGVKDVGVVVNGFKFQRSRFWIAGSGSKMQRLVLILILPEKRTGFGATFAARFLRGTCRLLCSLQFFLGVSFDVRRGLWLHPLHGK